jgi:hypothetical protein
MRGPASQRGGKTKEWSEMPSDSVHRENPPVWTLVATPNSALSYQLMRKKGGNMEGPTKNCWHFNRVFFSC